MTVHRVYLLECDQGHRSGQACEAQYDEIGEIAADLRHAAAAKGWAHRRVLTRHGVIRMLDLCPEHAVEVHDAG